MIARAYLNNAQMRQTIYNRRFYRQMWDSLFVLMGGKCEECGEDKGDFVFHHPRGKKWKSSAVSSATRIRKYYKDFSDGNLQLLCKDCHDRTEHFDFEEEVPF